MWDWCGVGVGLVWDWCGIGVGLVSEDVLYLETTSVPGDPVPQCEIVPLV